MFASDAVLSSFNELESVWDGENCDSCGVDETCTDEVAGDAIAKESSGRFLSSAKSSFPDSCKSVLLRWDSGVLLAIGANIDGSMTLKRLTPLAGTIKQPKRHSGSAQSTTRQRGAICLRAINITQ
ncbi:MAG: hypothetical protein MUC83_14760, partial [Pirellula sp.]|nr:hypothetical protein [Pirellula sp.]